MSKLKKFRSLDHAGIVAANYISSTFTVNGIEVNIGDKGWKLGKWLNSPNKLGYANYRTKEICLSAPLYILNLENNPEKLIDTILHEIAHAIHWVLYKGHSHDELWSDIAKQIGADGQAKYKYSSIQHPVLKYTLVCNCCGDKRQMLRKPKYSYSCNKCHPGSYSENFKMKIVTNY